VRDREDRGWVVVLSPPDEPRVVYCPDCLAGIVREASAKDEQDKDD